MKTQMRFQKILFKVALVIAALTIVYAVSFCTGAIAYVGNSWLNLYNATSGKYNSIVGTAFGDTAYYDDLMVTYSSAQDYTNILIWLGVVFILLVVVCYIFANSSRRNYYAANFITTIILAVYAVVWAVIAIYFSAQIQSGILGNVGWMENVPEIFEGTLGSVYQKTYSYSTSTWIYNVGYIVAVISILLAVVLIGNCIWKGMLMKGEKQLLNGKQNVEAVKEVA